MGFIKQIRLLTHHKLLLRRRQPSILLFELFWPSVVFFTVFLIRTQFLPEDRPTCYYDAKAMPSAGAVNFVQSMVCSIENQCTNASAYQEVPLYANAKIHSIVDHLSPLLTDPNVTSSIRDLPKGIRLIATVVDTLTLDSVRTSFKQGVSLEAVLRNNGIDKVKQLLAESLADSYAPDEGHIYAEMVVKSSINLIGLARLSQKSNYSTTRELFCNGSLFGEVILLADSSALGGTEKALCSLSESQLKAFTSLLQVELDFERVLEQLSHLVRLMQLPDTDEHLENMAFLLPPPTDDHLAAMTLNGTNGLSDGHSHTDHGPVEPYLVYDEDKRETIVKVNGSGSLDQLSVGHEFRIEKHEVGNLDTPEQLDGDLLMVESAVIPVGEVVNDALHDLLNSFIDLVKQGIYKKANLTEEEVPGALEALQQAAQAMPLVKEFVDNFTRTLDLDKELSRVDLGGDAIDLLGSAHASEITSKLMCGQQVRILDNEFQMFKGIKGLKEAKLNEQELNGLPSEFCQKGYRQVMQMSGGPVIWSFMKPLLAGKILFSPNNEATKQIMSKMNGTFTFMEDFKTNLESWTNTIISMQAFYKGSNTMDNVQEVKPLLTDFFGRDIDNLFDDSDSSKVLERMAKSGGVLGLVKMAGNIAQCFQLDRFIGLDSELELEEAAKQYTKSHELMAAVVFLNVHGENAENVQLPKNIEYKIRADIDFVPTTKLIKERIWEPGARANYIKDLGYLRGFVQVQEMLDRAITMIHINRTELPISPAVHLQQFPYLCHQVDNFGLYIRACIPIIVTVAWVFVIAFMIRERVLERELHLEEVLRVMGLKPSVAWITWFTIGFTVMAFGSASAIALLKLSKLVPHSNIGILYLYFLAFSYSIIMFCYMISSFFQTATIASLSGIVAYLATFLPFMVAITLEYDMTFLHKIGACLSMSTSFSFGIIYMARYEAQGVGIQLENMWQSPMADDPMNFATSAIMLLIDGLIYFLIGWYISNVFPPGRNGHRQSWLFFFLPSYWGFGRNRVRGRNLPPHLHINGINGKSSSKYCLENGYLEANWQRRPGMSLQHLEVTYNKGSKDQHHAVVDLTLELKEGQITTLLGRNGAGKTTTISVLTGQLPPTSGSVFVYGHQVPEDFSEARKLLGYCPQYNTLFQELTVREHLLFFSELKGLLASNILEADVDETLHNTGLWTIQHEQAKNLSGGLQRRLCVAMAFVGGSKLIILDEPTASVDPVARRSIWDMIVQQKQSRTVLLTTHHMDEAGHLE
ncbi:Glucosylceramide transporter ABCA12 [Halotydeus destructor]|nr:Glucosylceramide transporter ABCA12 [Halotydeus destructor]